MERLTEELVELGTASVETKGISGPDVDKRLGQFQTGLTDE